MTGNNPSYIIVQALASQGYVAALDDALIRHHLLTIS